MSNKITSLEKEIVHIVDRLIKCPKNQTDNLIRKLRELWKKRSNTPRKKVDNG